MQNAVAEVYEGVNITKSSDAVVTEISEQSLEKVTATVVVSEPVAAVVESRVLEPEVSEEPGSAQVGFGGIGDGVAAMHGDLSLERCSDLSQMDVDGCRDASHGTGLHGHDEKDESGMRT